MWRQIIGGVVIIMALVVIFVKAGQKTGVSGGQQAANIISAGGNFFSGGVSALYGG